jgi:spectrin beta
LSCLFDIFQARLEINDLFTDFGDGVLLMKFLEIISGEKLGKPHRGRMRVHKIENLNKCLAFLKLKRIQVNCRWWNAFLPTVLA